MSRYRKKAVEVRAIQWTGDNLFECLDFLGDDDGGIGHNDTIFINTLEGRMSAQVGDYLIQGVQGENYPCKPEIFEATYEPVEESER